MPIIVIEPPAIAAKERGINNFALLIPVAFDKRTTTGSIMATIAVLFKKAEGKPAKSEM